MSRSPQPATPDARPALVLGEGVTLLGTLRALTAAGIPCYAASHPDDITRWSRHYRRLPGAPLRSKTATELAEDLARCPIDDAVLIPCSDSSAVAVASLPDALRDRYPACCSSAEIQAVLADKLRFSKALLEYDVPHPRTIEVASRKVLEDFPDEDVDRFFLKPHDSESFSRRYGLKACLLKDKDKDYALGKYDLLARDGHKVVLQEYIPGSPSRHHFVDGFVDREGRIKALFARQRVRMYPPSLGNSSCMISVPAAEMDAACRALGRLLAGLGVRGIFSAEFKRDPRDGIDKLLEINARPWWYIGFAHACGFNAAAMAYRDALGLEVPELGLYPVGRWCVYPRIDLKASFKDWRAGTLDKRRWLAAWLRGSQPLFTWSDPGPQACELLRMVSHAFGKLVPGNES